MSGEASRSPAKWDRLLWWAHVLLGLIATVWALSGLTGGAGSNAGQSLLMLVLAALALAGCAALPRAPVLAYGLWVAFNLPQILRYYSADTRFGTDFSLGLTIALPVGSSSALLIVNILALALFGLAVVAGLRRAAAAPQTL